MGIDVGPNFDVTFSSVHQNRVNTSAGSNPTSSNVGGISVNSIYKRLVHTGGDGNPLIYALKRKKNYSISKVEIKNELPNLISILDCAIASSTKFLYIPMPSSHHIARRLAKVAAIRSEGRVCSNVFEKVKNIDVINELNSQVFDKKIKKDGVKLLDELSKSPQSIFSMKNVKNPNLRMIISPLKLINIPNGTNIVLVDDLISSGATIVSAVRILNSTGINYTISGLALLSPV